MLRSRGAFAALSLLFSGCILGHDRCDAHQVEVHGDFAICICEPNAVFNASGVGCTPCGANEVAQNGACTCKDGFAMVSADAGCEASSAGAACNATTPCPAAFPSCIMPSASDGYCSTSGCSSNADCPAGWSCEPSGSTHYCHRPPTGLGVACTTSADCASFEANYCETFSRHTCILQGCAQKTISCPNEWACCDYSALLGSPLSICLSPTDLTGGACPSGGTQVAP